MFIKIEALLPIPSEEGNIYDSPKAIWVSINYIKYITQEYIRYKGVTQLAWKLYTDSGNAGYSTCHTVLELPQILKSAMGEKLDDFI